MPTPTDSTACLIDTNILIYAVDASEVEKRNRSIEVLSRLIASKRGILSIQSVNEFFAATTRVRPGRPAILTEQEAEHRCRTYLDSWACLNVIPAATAEALRARRQYRMSYWDALLWATARLNAIPTYLTEDLQHDQLIEGVRVLNPLRDDFDLSLLD